LLFARNDIGVAKPIPMTDGQYIWELEAPEGKRYGVLFEEAIQNKTFDRMKKVKLIGEHLALIHQSADSNQLLISRKEYDFVALRDNPLHQIWPYLNHRLEDYRYLCEASERLVTYIENKISRTYPTYGFCHGDLHTGNVHFDGVRPAIFDFDCMGYGYRAYDICIYAWNESYREKDYLESEEWSGFLEGYESVRKLESEEKETMIPFIALRQLWLMGLHAEVMDKNAGCSWYNDDYFDEQIGIFKRFYESFKLREVSK
jgi:Ser/Thr protein kinase RdoA (MazF antagonist)